jgi:hypothetical protein
MAVTLSVGLLALSALGGTAFAHWGPGNADAAYEKIAETLGEDQSTVADAFTQAADEARDAAIAEKLARLIEAGALTQAEADEIQAWYDSAPESLENFPHLRGGPADLDRVAELLGVDVETLQTVAGDACRDVAVEAYTARLDAAVAEERLTQEEADAMLQAFEDRPQREMGDRGEHGRREMGNHGQRGGPHHRGGFGGPHDMGGMRGMAPADAAPEGVDPVGLAV